ncbi:aminotransferase class V-fold PLP-dependent enzyme [Cyclobacterium jeungdonense]|uniref:Aminotransferase class V-fold PLP-dependent enzyme n=1 Tax=Cyclobacterium jeungdonense TaxID=708087 RepID=A0ABT8C7K6_9BACT|nr:aminotransferase class V-fold PLP-dependent enzyme [Cyclobacterium jeungdonense]MDN3687798.1 aminotransferase class V-fold PLP-dependent enzyme [Cyclobacterium jeungdonense]
MLSRRKLLKRLGALPLVGGLMGSGISVSSAMAANTEVAPKRNLVQELGLRSFVNAAGTYTAMTASLMPKEVMEAINYASRHYVMLDEVQDKVGERIAALCHAEAATVTAGCWSAMVLGTAGVLTGKDRDKIRQLPNLEGMKSEVIVQKSHNVGYVHAITNTGVKVVEVETAAEVDRAVNDKTAMMWFLNYQAPDGKINHEEWVALGKKHGIPTMIDMAADVPPVENLWKYNDMGFDLVCVSGGKAIKGPQSAGILMGRKDLIEAARLSAPPRGGTIGRGMKVNKEEILGMYVALDEYIKKDHDKEWKEWEEKVAYVAGEVEKIDGVTTDVSVPPIANHTPYLKISWDDSIQLTREQMQEKLRLGEPSIEVISGGDQAISMTVFMLRPKEEKIVAKRIVEELRIAKV